MGKTAYVVDVSTLLYKSFYGRNNNNILHRFFIWIYDILDKNPDYLVLAFDEPDRAKLYRRKLLEKYKSDRKPKPQEILDAEKLIEGYCKDNGLNTIRIAGQECDDVIATFVKKFSDEKIKSVVVTLDGDLCSLFDNKLCHIGKLYIDSIKICDTWDKVQQEFGKVKCSSPDKLREVMAFVGDKSDNIPNAIKGYGVVRANKLIEQVGNIKALYDDLSVIPESHLQKFIDGKEQLFLNRKLIKLHNKLDVGDIEDYRFESVNYDASLDWLDKHGLSNLLYSKMYSVSDLNGVDF